MLQIQDPRKNDPRKKDKSTPRHKLERTMLSTVGNYGLIDEGDKILVAVSGGKDSYTLLDLLEGARRKAPVKFELVAVHLDQAQPGYDGKPLEQWLQASRIPHQILREDTYSAVMANSGPGGPNEGDAYCRVCSRLRRGILYDAAEKLGCNKLALGHHRDDALETLLMNLFFSGKLQAMPASYKTNDERYDVIRPMIECGESLIAEHAASAGYPILPCNLCGSQTDLKRVRMKKLLEQLEAESPDVRSVMLAALRNVRPSHLLDREVTEAWLSRAGDFAPRR